MFASCARTAWSVTEEGPRGGWCIYVVDGIIDGLDGTTTEGHGGDRGTASGSCLISGIVDTRDACLVESAMGGKALVYENGTHTSAQAPDLFVKGSVTIGFSRIGVPILTQSR